MGKARENAIDEDSLQDDLVATGQTAKKGRALKTKVLYAGPFVYNPPTKPQTKTRLATRKTASRTRLVLLKPLTELSLSAREVSLSHTGRYPMTLLIRTKKKSLLLLMTILTLKRRNLKKVKKKYLRLIQFSTLNLSIQFNLIECLPELRLASETDGPIADEQPSRLSDAPVDGGKASKALKSSNAPARQSSKKRQTPTIEPNSTKSDYDKLSSDYTKLQKQYEELKRIAVKDAEKRFDEFENAAESQFKSYETMNSHLKKENKRLEMRLEELLQESDTLRFELTESLKPKEKDAFIDKRIYEQDVTELTEQVSVRDEHIGRLEHDLNLITKQVNALSVENERLLEENIAKKDTEKYLNKLEKKVNLYEDMSGIKIVSIERIIKSVTVSAQDEANEYNEQNCEGPMVRDVPCYAFRCLMKGTDNQSNYMSVFF